ncbi:MAG: tetratricopeptide repeat protein [Candidatus Marinimicrobia bacterium]|nr:tetratricopeptide repeat protein [Candidatus Neomarinimicrobiota bacterium]
MKINIKLLEKSFKSKKYDETIVIAKTILKESLSSQTKDKAIAHFYLAQSYEIKHDFTLAKGYFEKALSYFEKNIDEKILYRINNNLGIISIRFDQFEDSEKYFEKALHFAERLKDQEKVFSIMNNIASIRRSIGDLYSAIELYQQCNTYAKKIKKPYFIAMSLYNLTRCKLILNEDISNNMLGDIDKAISLFEKEKYFDDSNGAKNVKAGILLSLGKINESLAYIHKVKNYYKSKNDTFRYLSSNLDNAKFLSKLGENDNAIQLVAETVEMAKQNDYQGIIKEGTYALSVYYNKIENYKKEAHYLKKIMKFKAEISKQVYQKNIERRTIEIEKLMVERAV